MKKHYYILAILLTIMVAFVTYVNTNPRKLTQEQINILSSLPSEKYSTNFAKNDQRRVFQIIQTTIKIQRFFMENGRLPSNDSEIPLSDPSDLKDPVTGMLFEYKLYGEKSFGFCVNFQTDTMNKKDTKVYFLDSISVHPKGYFCSKTTFENIQSVKEKVFEDKNIKNVITEGDLYTDSKFPIGFFSSSDSEYGFKGRNIQWVEITFVKPVKIKTISVLFDNCKGTYCAALSVAGETSTGNIDRLIDPVKTYDGVLSTVKSVSDDFYISLKIRVGGNYQNPGNEFQWKRIKFEYIE